MISFNIPPLTSELKDDKKERINLLDLISACAVSLYLTFAAIYFEKHLINFEFNFVMFVFWLLSFALFCFDFSLNLQGCRGLRQTVFTAFPLVWSIYVFKWERKFLVLLLRLLVYYYYYFLLIFLPSVKQEKMVLELTQGILGKADFRLDSKCRLRMFTKKRTARWFTSVRNLTPSPPADRGHFPVQSKLREIHRGLRLIG